MSKVPLLAGVLAGTIAFGTVAGLTGREEAGPVAAAGESQSFARARESTGFEVFNRMGCGSCHRLAAAGSTAPIGPNLDERLKSHTADSLQAKIISPGPASMMPQDFGERMSDDELDALVGFLLASRP